jgi:M6 family metalloprotease-like protein
MSCQRYLQQTLLATLFVCSAGAALAAPATSTLHTLNQADGSSFQGRQWGDEYLSGWETADGYSIVFDATLKTWAYARRAADGSLVSSGQPVGSGKPAAAPHLRPDSRSPAINRSKRQRQAFAASVDKPVTPQGTGKALTVLTNFSDTKATYGKQDFDGKYFAGSDSLSAFYSEQSRGVFTLTAGPAGVVNWLNLAKTHDYYGADAGSNKDVNIEELANEVAAKLVAANFDFAPYDTNGDCYVDVLSVIYQGLGQHESGNVNDIWPKQFKMTPVDTQSDCPSGGKIKVSNFSVQPEVSNAVSAGGMASYATFAHEYGHALGLPDLYDTTYASSGVGNWSLMSDGDSKAGDGKPIGFDAWSKLYLGWVKPVLVSGTLSDVAIEPVLSSGKVYQFGSGTATSGEYFLLENRTRTGSDSTLLGNGLLLWHIDGDVVKARYDSNSVNDKVCYPGGPNCASQHAGVALVQADNLWQLEKNQGSGDAADPFPGSGNVTGITDSTSPSLNLYAGTASGYAISGISASGSNIVATLSAPAGTAASGDADRLFNWAESLLPQFFPKGATTQTLAAYTYRYYAGTGTYLATANGRVIVHNGKDWNLLDVGALSDLLGQAKSAGF